MINKKRLFLVICLTMLSISIAPAVDLTLGALFSYNLVVEDGKPGIDFDDFSDVYHVCVGVEVPMTESIGARFDGAVKFAEVPMDQVRAYYNKNIHWDGGFGVAWHLFGYQRFDVHVSGGAACAGAVFHDNRWDDFLTRSQLVIFFHGGAGVNLILADSLILGAQARVPILSFDPTGHKTYDLFPLAARIVFGIRL